jgi:hypothetical protein
MIMLERNGRPVRWRTLARGLVAWALLIAVASAQEVPLPFKAPDVKHSKGVKQAKRRSDPTCGTLGYGPPGLHPGFQGFGLGYHPGYGFGGAALGTGAEGGYPYYGGPGYPHPAPRLNRLSLLGIEPFAFFGGPGAPTSDCPHFFGQAGPLVPDEPMVTFEPDPASPPYEGGYGQFNGTLPYPESTFALYVTSAGQEGSPSQGTGTNPAGTTASTPSMSATQRLGLAAETFDDRGQAPGLKVDIVVAGGLADRAGLKVGDRIQSINGFQTQKPADLDWIIEREAGDKVLRIVVRSGADGKDREVRVTLP